ncbi:transcription elongation factor [Acidilobus sp.]|jgi:DNA-directed RNA polymerase subunit M|uniref:transcription elongation factor n=1 Tax=Acidilobus sp. TaxID=1872109 RepID=UPI003D048663
MRFCPRCGGVMVPVKKGDKTILKCTRCGYEMALDKSSERDYKGASKADEKKVLTTTVVSKEVQQNKEESKEELEQAKEDYYELVLDEMGEYGDQTS